MKKLTTEDLPSSCEEPVKLLVPASLQRGHVKDDPQKVVESGLANLRAIGRLTGTSDWSDKDVLDYGCGAKFTQTIVQYDLPVKNYVGIDVHGELVDYLTKNVRLPNLRYRKVLFRNEMYNGRSGVTLTPSSALPCGAGTFDLILLQSVFTHFNPQDFQSLLHVLRRYAKGSAKLFFTCFIDNALGENFYSDPKHFLLRAYYRESCVREMLRKSGWSVLSVTPPSSSMQHQFVCEPAELSGGIFSKLLRAISPAPSAETR